MAGRKDNIKSLFTDARTRVIVLFTVILLLLTISIGYYKFKSPSLSVDAGANVQVGPGGIRSIPGSANQTAQYAFLQEKQNIEQAKSAEKSGSSSIPTLVRSQAFGDGVQAVGPTGGSGALGFSGLSQADTTGPQQSLWLQELKDAHCSKSAVKKVLSQGAGLSDLKGECTCAQLKENGYHLSELQFVCACPDLKAAGYTAERFKAIGFSAEKLKKCGFSFCDLESAGFSAGELKEAGFSESKLKAAGYTDSDIARTEGLPDGVTTTDVQKAGCSVEGLRKLRAQGVSAVAIRRINGCSPAQMKAAGYTLEQLRSAGFTAAELKNAGFSEAQLKAAGFNTEQISTKGVVANCSLSSLKSAIARGVPASAIREKFGCSVSAMKAAGYTAAQLKAAGFTAAELKNAGFNARELKAAGFSPRDLRAAGFSAADLKAAGFSPSQLREAGFTAKELMDAGFSAKELKDAGFSAAQLKAAGFSASDLKDAGFSAKDLKDAGFSAEQLKDAGFSANELKNAGYNPSELSAAGFSAKALKQAGYNNALDLVAAGFTPQQLRDAGFSGTENLPISTMIPSLQGPLNSRTAQTLADQQRLNAIMEQQKSRMNSQQYQQKLQQRTSTMTAAANQALQGWKATINQTLVTGSSEEKSKGRSSQIAGVSGNNIDEGGFDNSPRGSSRGRQPAIKAGQVLFAVMDTSVNSDQPGPILATIVAGKYKGAKLIGSFNLPSNSNTMVINFNMMSVPGAENTTSINAYAIDPNTARTALSSRTDHHYLLRYGSLFAATFIEGFGNAFQSQNTTITIGGTGGVSNTTVSSGAGRSVLENAVIGLSTLGKSWGQVAMQNVRRPTTVEVFSGTGVGILFTQDVAQI